MTSLPSPGARLEDVVRVAADERVGLRCRRSRRPGGRHTVRSTRSAPWPVAMRNDVRIAAGQLTVFESKEVHPAASALGERDRSLGRIVELAAAADERDREVVRNRQAHEAVVGVGEHAPVEDRRRPRGPRVAAEAKHSSASAAIALARTMVSGPFQCRDVPWWSPQAREGTFPAERDAETGASLLPRRPRSSFRCAPAPAISAVEPRRVSEPPIQLTVLRRDDLNIVDVAAVGSLIPRADARRGGVSEPSSPASSGSSARRPRNAATPPRRTRA